MATVNRSNVRIGILTEVTSPLDFSAPTYSSRSLTDSAYFLSDISRRRNFGAAPYFASQSLMFHLATPAGGLPLPREISMQICG